MSSAGDAPRRPIDFDADTTGYKLIAGWRFLDWLSVEGNWIDFGSASDRVPVQGGNLKIESDLDGVSVSVVGFLPIGPIDLFARAGVFNWDGSLNSGALAGKGSDDGTDLTYGVGAQFRLLSLSLRAEYERFDVDALDNADMISVGLTYTFL